MAQRRARPSFYGYFQAREKTIKVTRRFEPKRPTTRIVTGKTKTTDSTFNNLKRQHWDKGTKKHAPVEPTDFRLRTDHRGDTLLLRRATILNRLSMTANSHAQLLKKRGMLFCVQQATYNPNKETAGRGATPCLNEHKHTSTPASGL